jgi:hypothetical protein
MNRFLVTLATISVALLASPIALLLLALIVGFIVFVVGVVFHVLAVTIAFAIPILVLMAVLVGAGLLLYKVLDR